MLSERFAGRLRELRIEAGLSQQELADKTGMEKGNVSRLERGERSPSWETVLALCAALGVSCEAFTVEPSPAEPSGRGRPRKPVKEEEKPEPTRKKRK